MKYATPVRTPQLGRVREWHCFRCPTVVAWFDRSGFHLHEALTRLDGEKDGMTRYGRGHGGEKHVPTRRTDNLFLYCPACHAGQGIAP